MEGSKGQPATFKGNLQQGEGQPAPMNTEGIANGERDTTAAKG